MAYCRHYVVHLVVTVVPVFTATIQGHRSHRFDLQPGHDDVVNSTWPPTSVNIELFPADEFCATVSDRKEISVHVTVAVARPRRRTTNHDNTTMNGHC